MVPAMPLGRNVLALVFDFDDTLVPDSTTKFLRSRGIDTADFWSRAGDLVRRGYDTALAWLTLFLQLVGEDRPLGKLTNADLREFGRTLDNDAFAGLPAFFYEVRATAAEADRDAHIEFYIVSGGLKEIITSCGFIAENFRAVYASELGEDENHGLNSIKRAVNFTEKTRYLFEINKGLDATDTSTNPFLVNKVVDQRRTPWENMIYVGDGLTDVPCFSLVSRNGGRVYGVFNPAEESRAKRAFEDLLAPQRVSSLHSPRFGAIDDLGSGLRLSVGNRITALKVEASQATH
ncbi:MAG: haloacid dehalogenase-like hydrolase [Actinobacteria bacterium]|nr:haloacid dehalogenase-like hydrolase [Actinomycetota bacterium]